MRIAFQYVFSRCTFIARTKRGIIITLGGMIIRDIIKMVGDGRKITPSVRERNRTQEYQETLLSD